MPHVPQPSREPAPSRAADHRRRLGADGEQIAADHLVRRGFTILARNYRTRSGELDIVAASPRAIVFCEVKTLYAGSGREPFDAITPRKRAKVRRMAATWLSDHTGTRPRVAELRFDAIGILLSREDGSLVRLDHLEGAF